jgi:hypothetical protein
MIDERTIQQTVARLARPNRSGGHAVERAALLAEGSDFEAIEAWILQRGGAPQMLVDATPTTSGLHGPRPDAARSATGPPVRYVIPAGALA